MKLFWVTTVDHEEDWFIVAENSDEAAILHEEGEGFEIGEAKVKEIITIPEEMNPEKGWPSHELLQGLGAIFICDNPRVVELNGIRYCEGMEGSFIDEVRGKGGLPGKDNKDKIH